MFVLAQILLYEFPFPPEPGFDGDLFTFSEKKTHDDFNNPTHGLTEWTNIDLE